MIDLLLTIMIVLLLMPITLVCFSVISNSLSFDESVQDEIALAQLRHILLCSYDIQQSPDELTFSYQDKEMRLSCINSHLILQPGTQIFLSQIDSIAFEESNHLIMILYERKGEVYERTLIPQS